MENQDDPVSEMTFAMEVIQLPDDENDDTAMADGNNYQAQQQQPRPPPPPRSRLMTPDPAQRRPLDDVSDAGPPANPIDFSRPQFERGRRDSVLCYNEAENKHDVAHNVLFRDFSHEYGDADGALHRVKQAYWPIKHKRQIQTIMGHVEICIVLSRCIRDSNDSSSDDGSSGSSSGSDEAEEDIVFQVTNKYVAVKVCYCDRMDRLRDQHAEDPLKEIAAMQLIGNSHPNVMGTLEILFDGTNLNVVMPYCNSGDLFQLLQEHQRGPEPGGGGSSAPGMSEPLARYWFRQVMAGVQYLHSKGICHRDLSPENVMIDETKSLIIDMGMCLRMPYTDPKAPAFIATEGTSNGTSRPLASSINVTDISRGTNRRLINPQGACGKLPYMSPEIYRNRVPFDGVAVDVWTAGTILFCMVTGNRSYQRPHSSDAQFYWMTNGLERLIQDWGVTLSDECLHLLQNMMQVDPRTRLTVEEVLNHPWFAHPDQPPLPLTAPPHHYHRAPPPSSSA